VYKSRPLALNYKWLIISAAGVYLIAGTFIFSLQGKLLQPEYLLSLLFGFLTNTLSYSGKEYHAGAVALIAILSIIILPYYTGLITRKLGVIPMAITDPGSYLDSFSLISDDNRKPSLPSPGTGHSNQGVAGDNKGMIMVADGKVMFVNKDFCQMSGFSPSDIIGKDFVEFIVPQDILKYTSLIRTSRFDSLSFQGIGLMCPNHKELDVYIAGNKNTSSNPNDICLFHVRERSEYRKNEQSVTDWFVNSFAMTSTYFWLWDDRGMIYLSPNTRALIQQPFGLIMNKPLFMFKMLDKKERREVMMCYEQYLNTGTFDEEIRIQTETGSRWYRVQITPHLDERGELIHHVGLANDITDQKQKMDALESACNNAVNASYNKTAFLANMSHEIRSPLNGILGFSELLADPDLTIHERDRYIEIIKNNGIALLSILTDIIDISKLESGKMKILEKEFQPAGLMRELQLQFAKDPMVTLKGLSMKWMISDEIDTATLISDPFRVRQVLVNLITNALKYTNEGDIEVAAERWGDRAVFWVKDTGIGMTAESLPYIFDRYRQVSKTATAHSSGFGLGLAICKALVEILGGNIWVESEPGQGTIFYFTIPYSTPKQTEMSNMNSNETAFPYDWKGRTILIAEDIDFSFLYIEAVLRRTGAKVLWAQNGREAIELVKLHPGIDIALMDIHMPIMNGYDATREIVSIRPDLPVIAQTAFVLPDDVKACYAAGCAGYLAKPIRREQLLNTLTDYFEKIDQRAAIEAGDVPVYRSKVSG